MGNEEQGVIQVPAAVLQDMLTYVEKSASLLEETGRVQVELHKRAPEVADALVKAGLLDADKRDKAIMKLQEPLAIMDSLHKTAEFINSNASPATRMGGPAEKEAGDKTPSILKESDRVYYSRLGFSVA